MKKRGFLILFVFLIAVKISFSLEQDLVFSGTVYKGDVKQIEGKEFAFIVIKDYVSVDIDVMGVTIKNGECKLRDNFNVCVSNVSWAYRNSTTWEDIYKALVNIYAVKSDLTLTQNIAKTELLVDEEADVKLSLENTADIPAENVLLTQIYPAEILVSDAEGCSLYFNTITFKGQVNPRQIRTCEYKIKGLKPVTQDILAEASYFDGLETKNITDTQTITVLNFSLEVDIARNKEKVTVGDNLELSLALRNINEDNDLTVTSFVFKVPNGFIIKKKPKGMEQNNNLLLWNGRIEKESEINFTADLTAAKSGKQIFDVDASYRIAEFLRDFNKSYKMDIVCNCPFIGYNVGNVVPGLKTDFAVYIKNPGNISFRNLKIDYNTNIPDMQNFSTAFGSILKGSTISLIEERIISPPEGEKYYFNISIIYESPFNEFFVKKEKITIPLALPEAEEEIEEEIEAEILNETETEGEIGSEIQNETELEEEIEVEAQGIEENITQETEEKEQAPKEEKEPIVLLKEEGKIPFEALSVAGIIILFIFILAFFRIRKGKKEEEKKETEKSKPGIEPPPQI